MDLHKFHNKNLMVIYQRNELRRYIIFIALRLNKYVNRDYMRINRVF